MRWTLVLLVAMGCVDPEGGPAAGDDGDDNGPDAGVPPGVEVLPLAPPDPADNASSPAKVALGRQLFWDPILSGDRTVACATCHDPANGYADPRPSSTTPGGRNALTVLNSAWNGSVVGHVVPDSEQAPMFWDSRAHSLEAQARGPITAAAEMMGTNYTATTIFPELVARLAAIPEYAAQFDAVFGQISEANIVKAIAAYERTLTNTRTSYDRFVAGDTTAMSPQAQRGLRTFTDNGCVHCHSGPMFSDYKLHDLRVPAIQGTPRETGSFRTPSLRNVAATGPYMHDGVFATIPNVFQFYRNATQNPVDPQLRGVRTPSPQQAPDVEAFLRALGDAPFDTTRPATVPSGLAPGGTR